jgi:hypothetical protein
MFLALGVIRNLFHIDELLGFVLVVGATVVIYFFAQQTIASFARTKGTMEIALIGLGTLSQFITGQFYFIDDKFTVMSAVYVAWTFALLWPFVRRPQISIAAEGVPVQSS